MDVFCLETIELMITLPMMKMWLPLMMMTTKHVFSLKCENDDAVGSHGKED